MSRLIPDPEFDDQTKWEIVGTGGTVTGGQLVFILANVIRAAPIPEIKPIIGRNYDYRLDIASVSPFGITSRALFGGVEIWTKADGAGSFYGEITAVSETGLVFQAIPGQYTVNSVQILDNRPLMHNRTLNALQFYDITVRHHEGAKPTYTFQWSAALPPTVTISSSAWATTDSNLTISNEANDNDVASARFSASDPGSYTATNTIVDSDGNTDQRIITFIFQNNNRTYDYGR